MVSMKITVLITIAVLYLLQLPAQQHKPGMLTIQFKNTYNGQPVQLYDSLYSNGMNEQFELRKLKYYVGQVQLAGNAIQPQYYLINQQDSASWYFTIPVNPGKYEQLSFLLGVDSSSNTSGAQTGALDPLNDMYWTWQSGYVMIKIEGTSPQSTTANNKMEYHLGGYSGPYKVQQRINLPFSFGQLLHIQPGKNTTVTIQLQLEKFWQQPGVKNIAAQPVCNTPGLLARQLALAFGHLFSIYHTAQPAQ
ncbi:MAG: hypothetical protein RL172_495 [Bacteroidota bacterium]|jgi:hypothetical protein